MEDVTRVGVDVTFLEMLHPPASPPRPLPPGWVIVPQEHVSTEFYRYLYDAVGRDYCWWMRQVLTDEELRRILDEKGRQVFLLKQGETLRGFFELEAQPWNIVNLAYFGLLPDAIGHGVGQIFLEQAVASAWARQPLCVRVNTCTADHTRALPAYLRVGFRVLTVVREEWDIPVRLGLPVPESLRLP